MVKKCGKCGKKIKFSETKHYLSLDMGETLLCKSCYDKYSSTISNNKSEDKNEISEEMFFNLVKNDIMQLIEEKKLPLVNYQRLVMGNDATINMQFLGYEHKSQLQDMFNQFNESFKKKWGKYGIEILDCNWTITTNLNINIKRK